MILSMLVVACSRWLNNEKRLVYLLCKCFLCIDSLYCIVLTERIELWHSQSLCIHDKMDVEIPINRLHCTFTRWDKKEKKKKEMRNSSSSRGFSQKNKSIVFPSFITELRTYKKNPTVKARASNKRDKIPKHLPLYISNIVSWFFIAEKKKYYTRYFIMNKRKQQLRLNDSRKTLVLYWHKYRKCISFSCCWSLTMSNKRVIKCIYNTYTW